MISHGSLPHGKNLLSVQGAVLRVDNCHSCLYTTDGSNVHHSTSFRCRDAPIPKRLVDSSRIQDHWYPGEGQAPASVCGAGTTSHCRMSSLIPSQDMTSLDMQIQSVRFITKPTATWVGNLLKIIEEFLSYPDPPALSGVVFWATFLPLDQGSEVWAP